MKKPVGHQTTCDQSLNLDTAVGCLMGTALHIVDAVYACSVKALLEMQLVGPKPKVPTSPALILQTLGFGHIFNNYVEHNNQGGDISRILEPSAISVLIIFQSPMFLQSPGGSDGKASAYNVEDPGSMPGSGRSPGEGNGNPFQYSCLENLMDGGAWRAAVHRVAKSRTQLSDFTLFQCFCSFNLLFCEMCSLNREVCP